MQVVESNWTFLFVILKLSKWEFCDNQVLILVENSELFELFDPHEQEFEVADHVVHVYKWQEKAEPSFWKDDKIIA